MTPAFRTVLLLLVFPFLVGLDRQPDSAVFWITPLNHPASTRLLQEMDVWQVDAPANRWLALLSPSEQDVLLRAGYHLTRNLQQTERLRSPAAALSRSEAGIPGYPCYRTVEETQSSLAALAAAHPDLARWEDIGDSWEKVTPGGLPGYDLHSLVLTHATGNDPAAANPKPRFLLLAEVHAREYATAEVATRFAEELVAGYGYDSDLTWLLDWTEVHLVPLVNPDGRKPAEQGYYHRKNTNRSNGGMCEDPASPWGDHYGTDLNRNNNFEWESGGSIAPCSENYRGPSPDSEPETVALQEYMRALFPDQRGPNWIDPAPENASGLMISLHAYGNLVLWPWGSTYELPPNAAALQTLGERLAEQNGYTPLQAVRLYPTTGTTDDWAYGELGLASYTIEMGDTFFQDCATFESSIWPANLAALRYALKASHQPYRAPSGPETHSLAVDPDGRLTATADGSRRSETIAAARYSLDAPPKAEGSTPLEPADGSWDSSLETITAALDLTCLPSGRHTLIIESQSSSGIWGIPASLPLEIAPHPALSLEAQPSFHFVAPGLPAVFTLTLKNQSSESETYTIQAQSGWKVEAPAAIGPLLPCTMQTFEVRLTPPEGSAPYTLDSATLAAVPASDPSQKIEIEVSAEVRQFGFSLSTSELETNAEPGWRPQFSLLLTNTGQAADTYRLSQVLGSWAVETPREVGPLDPGQTLTLTLTLPVPERAPAAWIEKTGVEVQSVFDPRQSAPLSLTTRVLPVYAIQAAAPTLPLWLPPAQAGALSVPITNTGNITAEINLSLAPGSFLADPLHASLTLPPWQSKMVDFQFQARPDARPTREGARLQLRYGSASERLFELLLPVLTPWAIFFPWISL